MNSKDSRSSKCNASNHKDISKSERLPKESTSTLTSCEQRSLDSTGSSGSVGNHISQHTKNGTISSEELHKIAKQDSKERKEDPDDTESTNWCRKTASKESSVDEMFSPVSKCFFFLYKYNSDFVIM